MSGLTWQNDKLQTDVLFDIVKKYCILNALQMLTYNLRGLVWF